MTDALEQSDSAARGNDVEMRRLSVVYANGNPDELDVRRVVRAARKLKRSTSKAATARFNGSI